MDIQELVQVGKDRAQANYEQYHWFVECFSDDEWIEFIGDMTTQKQLFKMMDTCVSVWNERSSSCEW